MFFPLRRCVARCLAAAAGLMLEGLNSCACVDTGEFDQHSGEFNQSSGEFNQHSGEFNHNSGEFNPNSGEFIQNSGEFDQWLDKGLPSVSRPTDGEALECNIRLLGPDHVQ
eukprot:520397-Prorocentrum_minimum.AAC.1